MIELIDQVFVLVKHGLLRLLPDTVRPLASMVISVGSILGFFGLVFAITTWVERKVLGRIQNRLGPNRVGPYGLLQPIADGIKALIKEDIVPREADRVVHFLAPLALLVPVCVSFLVLPYGRNMAPADFDAGLLFFFAVGAGAELAVFMAGWSGRNKYSLLGAMRGIAQMISYELPLILSAMAVVMVVGSMSLVDVVAAQSGYVGWIPRWHVLTPWGMAGFLMFLVAAAAEANRTPFDLPEAESEIVAGYFTEYSGFKFALFFLGEYLGMFAMSGMGVTLFLGGWHAPLPWLAWVPTYVWFFAKLSVLILTFIWARGTLPRLRMDQLLRYAWKLLLPLALWNLFVAGVWHASAGWGLPAGLGLRWVLCGVLVAGAYLVLSGAVRLRTERAPRRYRFAE